jgi:hypothetical protein
MLLEDSNKHLAIVSNIIRPKRRITVIYLSRIIWAYFDVY